MKIIKEKLTLLVCSTNQEKLNLFITKNEFVIKNIFVLYIIDFKLGKKIIPFSNKVIYLEQSSLSQKRNLAFKMIDSQYVSIVDDDCFFDDGWLSEIVKMIDQKEKCVFGNVLPNFEGKLIDTTCLVFIDAKSQLVDRTNFFDHFQQVGFTNNCFFEKDLVLEAGKFKEWLGPGTCLQAGEDADLILSLLALKNKIFHNQKLVVFHNSWTPNDKLFYRVWGYRLGGLAAYYYHFWHGHFFSFEYIRLEYLEICSQMAEDIRLAFFHPKNIISIGQKIFLSLFLIFITPLIGLYFFLRSMIGW